MKLRAFALFMVFVVFCGCVSEPAKSEKYCVSDSDCACGMHVGNGDCFYGNKEFVDTGGQCPDYCGGIGGHLVLRCVNSTCVQVRKSPN